MSWILSYFAINDNFSLIPWFLTITPCNETIFCTLSCRVDWGSSLFKSNTSGRQNISIHTGLWDDFFVFHFNHSWRLFPPIIQCSCNCFINNRKYLNVIFRPLFVGWKRGRFRPIRPTGCQLSTGNTSCSLPYTNPNCRQSNHGPLTDTCPC